MKRIILVVSLLTIAVLALSSANTAMAAESSKGGPGNGNADRFGFDGNNNRGAVGTGVPINRNISMDGLLEGIIHENLSIALGISTTELESRTNAGESIYDIGLDIGLTVDAISEMMGQVRADALIQAVELGLLSQDQYDWLTTRGYGTQGYNGVGDCQID
ncbi:MAG: hypothetical protein MUO54_04970 [Anaerolineales bacterium]|nr:hypothetical protein [Anaerolineales bacterium]